MLVNQTSPPVAEQMFGHSWGDLRAGAPRRSNLPGPLPSVGRASSCHWPKGNTQSGQICFLRTCLARTWPSQLQAPVPQYSRNHSLLVLNWQGDPLPALSDVGFESPGQIKRWVTLLAIPASGGFRWQVPFWKGKLTMIQAPTKWGTHRVRVHTQSP